MCISHCHQYVFNFSAYSYRNLLDLSSIGDDLLHDLHGLALGLSCRCLTLSCLDDLYLLAFTHLHGHGGALTDRHVQRKKDVEGKISFYVAPDCETIVVGEQLKAKKQEITKFPGT